MILRAHSVHNESELSDGLENGTSVSLCGAVSLTMTCVLGIGFHALYEVPEIGGIFNTRKVLV